MKRLKSINNHIKKIGFAQTLSYLFQRFYLKKGELIRLKVPGLKLPLYLRNRYYDTHIFHQIFIREEVDFYYDSKVKIIMDCGANIGLASLYFLRKFPDAEIISIEPEFLNFNLLKTNTQAYKNIKVLHSAVWFENKNLKIIDNGEGEASYITSETGSLKSIEEVKAFTINEIMLMNNLKFIDLLKMDIEGSEYEIFNNDVSEWLNKSNMIAVEIHEYLKPGVTEIIHSKMKTEYNKFMKGEYSVFIRKTSHNLC